MGVPLRYNFRSLVERKATTLMTAVGIALTVSVLVISLALIAGLRSTFAATGHPLQGIILRKGVTSELSSGLGLDVFAQLRAMPQVAREEGGEPLASGEVVTALNLPSVDSPNGMNVTVRGMMPVGMRMREVRIVRGTMFGAGQREVIVGSAITRRYPAAKIGGTIRLSRSDWTVVGVFEGDEMSALASEIWCDLNQLRSDLDRKGYVSSVLVRTPSAKALEQLIQAVKDNRRTGAEAMSERDYYAQMTVSGAPLEFLGVMVASIMAIGSGFGAMNTMYASVARRGKEIGTLRALGFSRFSILQSFMLESVMLSLFGGVLGCLLAMPLNNVTTGVGNFQTFSEVAFKFKVTPQTMLMGLGFAAAIGAVGGFLPARAAARRDLITTMREN
jgi:putative ABC transport system permease protein